MSFYRLLERPTALMLRALDPSLLQGTAYDAFFQQQLVESGLEPESRERLMLVRSGAQLAVTGHLDRDQLKHLVPGDRRAEIFLHLCADDVSRSPGLRGAMLEALAARMLPDVTAPLRPHVPHRLQCAALLLMAQREGAALLLSRIPRLALPEPPTGLPREEPSHEVWEHCLRACVPAVSGRLRTHLERRAPWEDFVHHLGEGVIEDRTEHLWAAITASSAGAARLWTYMGWPRTRRTMRRLRAWTSTPLLVETLLMREAVFARFSS